MKNTHQEFNKFSVSILPILIFTSSFIVTTSLSMSFVMTFCIVVFNFLLSLFVWLFMKGIGKY